MSDQDFFFDEDEKPAEESKAKPSGDAKSTASRSSRPAAAAATTAQSVTVSVAALIGVIALLVGVIIGILIPSGGAQVSDPVSTSGVVTAPELSSDQLNSGALPEGHPDIGSMGGTTATDTGSTETTE